MSSSQQDKQIKTALDAVDWAELASLSEQDIKHLWGEDQETVWPMEDELAEFTLVKSDKAKKPSQAAE